MKRLTISVLVLCVMTAIPTAAQQKLGDVAGSIKLKKSEGDAVVIDDSQMGRRVLSASSGAGGSSLLYDVMGDCLEASRSLAAVLADAPRISPLVYSEGFRTQLEEIGLQLESVSGELQMLPDAGPYEDAYQQAVVGLEQVQQGFSSAQVAVGGNRVVSSEVRQQVAAGADAIEAAMTAARAVDRAEAAVAPAPPIDPIAAASSIRTVCRRMGAEGSEAYQSCVNQQNTAVDALYSRSGPSVGLDEASFNRIRNSCRFEWPDNYFNRNACETRRAAAASGGS